MWLQTKYGAFGITQGGAPGKLRIGAQRAEHLVLLKRKFPSLLSSIEAAAGSADYPFIVMADAGAVAGIVATLAGEVAYGNPIAEAGRTTADPTYTHTLHDVWTRVAGMRNGGGFFVVVVDDPWPDLLTMPPGTLASFVELDRAVLEHWRRAQQHPGPGNTPPKDTGTLRASIEATADADTARRQQGPGKAPDKPAKARRKTAKAKAPKPGSKRQRGKHGSPKGKPVGPAAIDVDKFMHGSPRNGGW